VFLTDRPAGMANWTEAPTSAVGYRGRAASSKAGSAEANPRQNEAVTSPRVRQQIRLIAGLWLAWTIAELFRFD
jgi:hypothetical protein